MDVYQPNVAEQRAPEQRLREQLPPSANPRLLHLIAMIVGVVLALLVSSGGGPAAVWGKATGVLSPQRNAHASTIVSEPDLDRQRPQKQAEILLERAVSRPDGTTGQTEAQIKARIEGWRGALNCSDRGVRASAIEVQLAAYGLTKTESTVEALVRQASSSDHAKKIWALWTLGLLGNRGIETDRVVQVLTAQLKASGKDSGKNSGTDHNNNNEDARRWAVEGLALVGTTPTIAPLLTALHNDPSAMVRERAASSLSESGMLSPQQRLAAVPQLINYSDDPALDAQTHAWAFQALAGSTKQSLPNNSAAWRNWYQTSEISGQ